MRYPYKVDAAHKMTGISRTKGIVAPSIEDAKKQLEDAGFLISELEPLMDNDEQTIAAAEFDRMRRAVFWGVFWAMAAITAIMFVLTLLLFAVANAD